MDFDQQQVTSVVRDGWGWAVPSIDEVLAVNSMANVFLRDRAGQYWRICPEELSAKIEAKDEQEAQALFSSEDFKADWQLLGLIGEAEAVLGRLAPGQCFAMVTPAVMGGEYSVENLRIGEIGEYLGFTGYLANQIKDLPDGTSVQIKFVEPD